MGFFASQYQQIKPMVTPPKPQNLMTASNQWASRPKDERFETLEALHASVNSRRLRSRSVDVDTSRIVAKLDDSDRLVINGTVSPSEPSHWSFGQLATTLKAPAAYLRTLPKPLLVDCLNNGVKAAAAEREACKFMTVEREEDGANILQAVTSTTYGRIWDAEAVACVQRINERTGGKFFNPPAYINGQQRPSGLYASDRDVFMFMVDGGSRLQVGSRAQLHRGFIVRNSEVGRSTFDLITFLFNEVCGNHIIWGAQDIRELSIRHNSGAPTRFDLEATPALLAYANSSAAKDEAAINCAVGMVVIRDEKTGAASVPALGAFLNKHGKFTKGEVQGCWDFAKAEEGDCSTLWQVVQGLTAYARGFDWVDARVDLETRAGSLLKLAAAKVSAPVTIAI